MTNNKSDKIVEDYINNWCSEIDHDWLDNADEDDKARDMCPIPSVELILEHEPDIDADMAKQIVDGIDRRVVDADSWLDTKWYEYYKGRCRAGCAGVPRDYWGLYSWNTLWFGEAYEPWDLLKSDGTIAEFKDSWNEISGYFNEGVVEDMEAEIAKLFPTDNSWNATYDGPLNRLFF